jgi:hypothetical protein
MDVYSSSWERVYRRSFHYFFYLNIGGWSPYWVHSALWPLLAYCTCPGWLWEWRSWWNDQFLQGKPKYSKNTCPDATLSTTNPTCQTRARTRAAAVGSKQLTASAMARPIIKGCSATDHSGWLWCKCINDLSPRNWYFSMQWVHLSQYFMWYYETYIVMILVIIDGFWTGN